jgi:hypothetical protein
MFNNFFFVTEDGVKKVRMPVPVRTFKRSLMFEGKVRNKPSKREVFYAGWPKLSCKEMKKDWKDPTRTNTLAYITLWQLQRNKFHDTFA